MNKRISDEDLNMLIDQYFPKVDRSSHVIYWAAVELKTLREKARPKKPKIQQIRRNVIDPLDGLVSLMEAEYLVCPKCDGLLSYGRTEIKHCPECGQAIDWSEEE
ncbi:MAG: hypothetical protein V8Q42_11105 [Anaerovoracaceae bacterium]